MALVPPHTHPRHEHSQYLTLAEASAAGLFLPLAGGTLTGALTVDGGAGILSLKPGASNDHVYMQFFADSQAPGTRSAFMGFGSAGTNQFTLSNEMSGGDLYLATTGTGRAKVSADPTSALHVATKQYVDNADATKAATTHNHDGTYSASGHTHAQQTGVDSKFTINSPQGLTLHSPGVSVASIASFNYAGQYGIRFIKDWQGDSGALAPLQIGAPIDGNSAATVTWVQGDRAAASHSHSRTAAGYGAWSVDVGSLAAGTSYGPWYVGHAWPGSPSIIISDAVFDDGVHSVDTSIGTWDTVNTGVTAKNNHTAAESCVIVGISVI